MHIAAAAFVLAVGAHGVSTRIPPAWHRIPADETPCTNPIERLDVAGPGNALVMIQEGVGWPAAAMPRRPARFTVRDPPSYLSCCDAAGHGKGWVFPFRDHGRSFYAYVYPGRQHRVREALKILDGLRIDRRRSGRE